MASETRPSVVGDEAGPEAPYPLHMEGKVISGFGRGSKELGIPTANLPVDASQTPWITTSPSGVYYGWASLRLPASHPDSPSSSSASSSSASSSSSSSSPPTASQQNDTNNAYTIYPMVMSIGYNPFYKNTIRSAEVHLLHKFKSDFYDAPMRLLILGFIRPEKDYKSLEALVEDINFDCEVAKNSLNREGWAPKKGMVVGGEVDGRLDVGWLVRE